MISERIYYNFVYTRNSIYGIDLCLLLELFIFPSALVFVKYTKLCSSALNLELYKLLHFIILEFFFSNEALKVWMHVLHEGKKHTHTKGKKKQKKTYLCLI